jgi:eukaryotic-like serine/threonine-protein kinase
MTEPETFEPRGIPQDADSAFLPDEMTEDPRIVSVVQDYLAQLESGGIPDRAAFIGRYPELATAVAQCIEGLELLRSELPARRQPRGPAGPGASGTALGEIPADPLGDFQIVRELGRGGMGVVYEAIQLSLGRRVALKVLPFAATFDARQLQRFKNEAQAAALLHHTHIVPIYAVGSERGVHFYAMQLIEGQSLAAVIRQLRDEAGLRHSQGRHGEPSSLFSNVLVGSPGDETRDFEKPDPTEPRPERDGSVVSTNASAALTAGESLVSEGYYRRIARLMVQAASALDHAHQLGVVHRDVKPANLLVNSAGNLWVTDFGLALFQTDNGLTRSGDLLGTFRYMSPEQSSGNRTLLDHRTDIYSLGATLYELLTLEYVFSGETRHELLFQILNHEPKPPRALRKSIPPELETIALKALSKNPVERYASAGDMAADLQRYLDHQPIRARRPTLVDRLRKWSRRHPSVVIAGMLLLAVVAVALFISNRMISDEQSKTRAALERERQRATEAHALFAQARRAVDLLVEVSEDELADKPMVEGTRRRLLETALAYYQDFIAQRQGDAASQAELESVSERVQGILHELNLLEGEFLTGLLHLPSVRKDLVLADSQQAPLQEFLKGWAEERSRMFGDFPRGEQARRKRLVELAEEHDQAIRRLLTDGQRLRLKQIALQLGGLMVFRRPEIVQALALTAEQRDAIRDIEHETMARVFVTAGRVGNEGPRRLSPRRVDSLASVLKILTPAQRTRWNELIGAPFAGGDELLLFGPPGFVPPGGPSFRHIEMSIERPGVPPAPTRP